MERVRTWGLRVIAAVLGAGAALMAMVAIEADWPRLRFTRTPIEYSGVAAASFAVFLLGCGLVALVASSPRLSDVTQVRLASGLLIAICIGLVAFGYAVGA